MEYQARADGFYPALQNLLQGLPDFAAPLERARAALNHESLSPEDFAALLSPQAAPLLEDMARRARAETLRRFGRSVQLFAPLYLANVCTNRCKYCGFHAGRRIRRKILRPAEIAAEAKAMAALGLRRILVLTGDAPKVTGADYIAEGVSIAAGHIPSVGIEVQALTVEEYALIAEAGADGMTMFQETYDETLYADMHPAGPKRNFAFRLDAPQRAALGGMRSLTLGALLGLGDWRQDLFLTALHGQWLAGRFPEVDIAFSLPRLRPPSEGTVFLGTPVTDPEFVQALTALRTFLPHAGITMSSRESAFLRDRLVPLGVTRISAGVHTSVGGYVAAAEAAQEYKQRPVQFVIDDNRSVEQIRAALARMGYTAVGADWIFPAGGDLPLSGGVNRSLGLRAAG